MNKTKSAILVASILMIAGLLLAAAGFFSGAKLNVAMGEHGITIMGGSSDRNLKTQNGIKLGNFTSIDCKILNSNLRFVSSDHFGMDMTYYGDENKPAFSVNNGTLQITQQPAGSERTWFQISFDSQYNIRQGEITVYYPKGIHLNKLNIENDSGNTEASDFEAQSTGIECQYGNLKLKNASCGSCSIKLSSGTSTLSSVKMSVLNLKNSYGDCNFDSVQVSGNEESRIDTSSGKINLTNFSSPALALNDDDGSVSLSSLKSERLHAQLDSGNLNIADCNIGNAQVKSAYGSVHATSLTISGANIDCSSGSISLGGIFKGKTTLHSDYGNVSIQTSLPQSQYRCDFSTEYGSVKVNGKKYGKGVSMPVNAENSLDITANSGDVSADFQAETTGKTA
ncbi:MAG TPA: DUF4097 family beta strand repeat-containing protein [Caproicibacter sp.]|nr:DUF4097 family beta strand repeat-containing protein [Caproicibacter sp.]